jgi:hypothetical protein
MARSAFLSVFLIEFIPISRVLFATFQKHFTAVVHGTCFHSQVENWRTKWLRLAICSPRMCAAGPSPDLSGTTCFAGTDE